MSVGAWVQTATCPECGWTGMHWHWGDRRFRSITALDDRERLAFNAALAEADR